MLKRFANIFLIVVVLLITVQPRFVLHFCGDKFIALYINHDPSLIKSACNAADHSEHRDNCLTKSVTQTSDCENRNIVTVDIDSDDFTTSGSYIFPASADDVVLFLPETKQLWLSEPAKYLSYGKAPPRNVTLQSGRDIMTRNCVYLI